MRGFGKTRLIAFGASGVLALSAIGGVGLAAAQTNEGEPSESEQIAPDERPQHKHRGLRLLHSVVEASGLEGEVFRAGFGEGDSVNAILEANGLDPATVQADALQIISDKLDEKVAAGEMDAQTAAELLAKAEEALPILMDGTPPPPGERHGPRGHRAGLHGLETAAGVIGIELEDLVSQLREGDTTVAEIATDNGVDPQTVIDVLIAEANARIDQAEADGRIDADQAADMKARAAEKITQLVIEGRPEGGPGGPPPAAEDAA